MSVRFQQLTEIVVAAALAIAPVIIGLGANRYLENSQAAGTFVSVSALMLLALCIWRRYQAAWINLLIAAVIAFYVGTAAALYFDAATGPRAENEVYGSVIGVLAYVLVSALLIKLARRRT